ncbi:tRNA (adenosine(37)-N6)-threonylcarbamoyltransferase complex ATPase subunit type 1 TsaE [Nocardioidaceae bacterium]|nr:tRNA (adenosine(37)-N6)-threonylcarbamoyltransferase complex ATPase subunit type 1 TsaE [Nocardioidaceae bacterium]
MTPAPPPPIEVLAATSADAEEVFEVIRAAFSARPAVDPPPPALVEGLEVVRARLDESGGLIARQDGRTVGALLFNDHGRLLSLERVSVHPGVQGGGVAGRLTRAAASHARLNGYEGMHIVARADLPQTVAFWRRQLYNVTGRTGPFLSMTRLFAVEVTTHTAEETRRLGRRLAWRLLPGDLVILTGDLGAGKTTFTQGLGEGLRVRGQVTSPTFVISREHRASGDGPSLVHVDAYRLGGAPELDDLDLDTRFDEAVTVVEWGEGVAEDLADARLEISITRWRGDTRPHAHRGSTPSAPSAEGRLGPTEDHPDAVDLTAEETFDDEPRRFRINPVGDRWIGAGLAALVRSIEDAQPVEEPVRRPPA